MRKMFVLLAVLAALLFSCLPVQAAGTARINVPIEHKIEGENTDEMFHFTINSKGDAPLPENTTFSIRGSGRADINISYDAAGKYQYEVKELEGGNKATKYDDNVYVLTVTVTENDGTLTPVVTLDDGDSTKPEKLLFTSYFQGSATVTPKIKKVIENNKEYKDTFRFEITNGSGYRDVVSLKGEGIADFKDICFTQPGTFEYKIKELKDKKARWKYDDTVYTYKVTVIKEGSKLVATPKGNIFTFINKPRFARKVQRLASLMTGGGERPQGTGNFRMVTKTGDANRYLGAFTLTAALALVILVVLGRRKKK